MKKELKERKMMKINGINYKIFKVEDHLVNIAEALSEGLARWAKGEAVALDFSGLRPRGANTSFEGVSTGAASFVKTFNDMVQLLSCPNVKRHTPVAILAKAHSDSGEFNNLDTPQIIRLQK